MAAPKLNVEKREEVGGKKLEALRKEGKVPGTLYGPKQKSLNIKLDRLAFEKAYEKMGESTLLDIEMDGKEMGKGLIYDMQIDPLTRLPVHLDLYLVDLKKEIKVEIELIFKGVSAAVKELGGTLVKMVDSLEVMCLPEHLVNSIEVNISKLKTFDDLIRLEDLSIPEGIKPLAEPSMTIAKVEAPRTEEELAGLEEKVTEEVEGVEVEKEKKEGEEGAEGEGGEAAKEGAPEEKPKEEKK